MNRTSRCNKLQNIVKRQVYSMNHEKEFLEIVPKIQQMCDSKYWHRYIDSIAKKYGIDIDYDDILQEMYLQAIKCADNYEEHRQSTFFEYCRLSIVMSVPRRTIRKSRLIKVPEWQEKELSPYELYDIDEIDLDNLSEEYSYNPIDQVIDSTLKEELSEIMKEVLNPRERQVLIWMVYENKTQEYCKEQLNVSHQRIGQIKKRAIEKLQNNPKCKELEIYL